MKKEIGQVQEKKRKEKKLLPQYIITWIIVYVIIYQYLLSGVQHFCKKTMIFRAVCLKLKVFQTIS